MNIPEMSISDCIKQLSKIYIPVINGNLPYSSVPAAFLWGPPGVGKSEGINELAEVLSAKTGKKVVVTDIRLLLFSPIDLRGVPVADETRQFTDWLKPRIFDLNNSSNIVNILFLDELSAAPLSVQAAAYQLTLNRAIGEHKLPDNSIVIAAGNRTTDRAVAYKMPSALANRMLHFLIEVDFDSWKEWALKVGVNDYIIEYLSYDTSKLYMEDKIGDEFAFPSPRSWVFLSNILNASPNTSMEEMRYIIASCVGVNVAVQFLAWFEKRDLPSTLDIFAGKVHQYKGKPDEFYTIVNSIIKYALQREKGEKGKELSLQEVEHVCRFCCDNMSADYAMKVFSTFMEFENLKQKLAKSRSFLSWSRRHRKALLDNYEV